MFSCQLDAAAILYFHMDICGLYPNPGHFEKGAAEGAVDPSFNPVLALRLSVLKDSAVWAILSEVSRSLVNNAQSSHMTNTIYLIFILCVT